MNKRYADGQTPAEALTAREDVAAQVLRARKEAHLTQQNLADLTGTKKSNISRMESGRYNPSLDFLVKVASSMGKELSVKLQ